MATDIQPTIYQLPNEITEMILILSDHPPSIAAFSQTCRAFRSLIYDATDNHLWRSLYLTRFDDPGESLHLRLDHVDTVDWGEEYRRRVWAVNFLMASSKTRQFYQNFRSSPPSFVPGLSPIDIDARAEAWRTALTLLSTARPSHSRNPLLTLPESGCLPSLTAAHNRSPKLPQSAPFTMSKNIEVITDIFWPKGIPHSLILKLIAHEPEYLWDSTPEAQEFYRYIAYCGVAFPLDVTGDEFSTDSLLKEVNDDPEQPPSRLSRGREGKLSRRTLSLAQRRVYDMDYPQEQTMYGPFLRVDSPTKEATSYSLVPDWTHIAAIRQVVQQVIGDDLEFEDEQYWFLVSLNTLRGGWWVPPPTMDDGTNTHGMERDWAGVEGTWRRMVTWFGWGALLDFNHTNFERYPQLTNRLLVPIQIRIISYDHKNLVSPKFPTINIEGEIGGEDWDDTVEDPEVRHLTGNISMLVDGSVRWSMNSYQEGSKTEVEWISEGVQIGGVGSMAGILGSWTGTTHMEDPVGAWWQWRVA